MARSEYFLVALLLVCFSLLLLCAPVKGDEDASASGEVKQSDSPEEKAAQYRLLGDQAFKDKKYDTSLEWFSKAVAVQPDNFLNHYKRSGVYLMRGRNKKALRDMDKVIELKPDHVQTYVRRGKLLLQMGEYDRAEADLREALTLKPGNTIAQSQLNKVPGIRKLRAEAELLSEQEKWAEAREMWLRVVDVSDICEECWLSLSRCDAKLSDHDAVVQHTIKLLKVNARNLEGLLLRGLALSASGDIDTAMKFYRQGLKSDPENKKLKEQYTKLRKFSKIFEAAREAYSNQKWKDALENYRDAAEMMPQWHEVHIMFERMCNSLVQLRMPKEAIVECNRALGIRDDLFEAHLFKGEAYLLEDELDLAYREISRARQVNQNDRRGMDAFRRVERLQKMASRKDYYKILGVNKASTPKEIRKAYRKLALEWHPDKHKADGKEEAQRRFTDINEAYEVLNDEEKRGKYDRGEDLQEQPSHSQGHPFGGFGGGGGPFHFSFNFGG
eukprot:TRINITY_DN9231_c0_g1_i1.p1 TRINITY_DN9231_c0_g1~~TRINITY_DN9231_c0_g1_i1.p1  ORF type:complete len:500 (-),score=147.90 TRINITY_DN9231_c0_g1_i1:82-1581(-)